MARSKKVPIENRGSLTLRESMEYAGIGHAKARGLVKDGAWKAYANGREIRVIKRTIDEWMEAQAAAAVRLRSA